MAVVVVTGASGHVGANLVRQLLARGDRVRAVVYRREEGLGGLDIERVQGNILEIDSLRPIFRGAEVVYHLAAQISIVGPMGGRVEAVNVEGARNVAEVAWESGVRRLVHCSSVHAFEHRPSDEALDEQRARAGAGTPAYDQSKVRGEAAVRAVVARGLDAVIVHPSGVIGPHDYQPSRMGQLLLATARRRMPGSIAGGFDWVDVRDVCQGLIAAGAQGRSGESYLLSGRWCAIPELMRQVSAWMGVGSPPLTVPLALARPLAPLGLWISRVLGSEPLLTPEGLFALEHGSRCIQSTKAARELGYQARPLAETLRDTLQFFADQGLLPHPPRAIQGAADAADTDRV